MTDKEIVLELTKAVLMRQPDNYAVLTNPAKSGSAVATIFNTIAEGITPTLDKLNKDTKKD